MRRGLLIVAALSLLMGFQGVWAQIPGTLSYQGILRDDTGQAVRDSIYNITFSIYDISSGGSPLWTEVQAVDVQNGIFSVILGKTTPLAIAFDQPYWLGVTVEGSPEFSPRRELTAAAYSLNTKSVEAGAITESALADNAVTGAKIADDAVGSTEIASGTVVRSLNTLKDDVTLAPGANVTITASADTITIGTTGVGSGDVTGVIAGDGLTGGGLSGDLTLHVGAGSGIALYGDSIALADNSVSGAKIVDGTVVRSLNTLTDDVTLAAGANVTITPSGDTLTIASTGAADSDWTISGNDMYSAVTGNVGIGITNPAAKLDVVGDINTDTDYKIDGYTTLSVEGTNNILVGTFAGRFNTGNHVTIIGSNAGRSNAADYNMFIGTEAGYSNTNGHSNTFIGYRAGRYNEGGNTNTFIGREAGRDNTSGGNNTFVGFNAGLNNTTGFSNTFLGKDTGVWNDTGNSNTFVGRASGPFNTIGRDNVFLGTYSGYLNTTGRENVFLGSGTGYDNTTGSFNTFLGRYAGRLNQTGEGNVFIGYNAGYYETESNKLYIDNSSTDTPLIYGQFDTDSLDINGELDVSGGINIGGSYKIGGGAVLSTVGTMSTLVGANAGTNNTGSSPTFVGFNAGLNNEGDFNTFVGVYSGLSNTTGTNNTFIGMNAGQANVSGSQNTFVGRLCGYNNLGTQNTFIGQQTAYNNTTGSYNTFLGRTAGYANTTGIYNTFLGYAAGYDNAGGNYNTCVGRSAGAHNVSGSYNVFLGYEAGFNENTSNKLYIANGRFDSDVLIYGDFFARRVGIATVSPGYTLDVAGQCHATSFPTSSDERLKENVTQLTNVLDKLEKIRGVSFEWNAMYESLGRSTGRKEIGVIAQEVEAVFPELVTSWGEEDYRAVDYGRMTGVLIEAIKELRAENDALKKRIEALEKAAD